LGFRKLGKHGEIYWAILLECKKLVRRQRRKWRNKFKANLMEISSHGVHKFYVRIVPAVSMYSAEIKQILTTYFPSYAL
jgi:hypothetical protein